MNASQIEPGNVILYPMAVDTTATVVNIWDPQRTCGPVELFSDRFMVHVLYRRKDGALETTWLEFMPDEQVTVVCEAFQLQGAA